MNATNTGEFSIVSPYLKKESELYNDQRELVNRLYKNGTTEQFYDMEINSITRNENVFTVGVTVQKGITHIDKEGKIRQLDQVYTVEQIENEWLLSKVE